MKFLPNPRPAPVADIYSDGSRSCETRRKSLRHLFRTVARRDDTQDSTMEGDDAMPPSTERNRLTYDDFLLFPNDGKRHELIDGEHFVSPSPNLRHQELLGRLYLAIAMHLSTRRHLGRVLLSPFDVVFTRYDVVAPDLLFVAGDQIGILTRQNVQGPPALVVEITSPGTRRNDEQLKRDLFERGGVREYWLVDPADDTVKVFRREEHGSLRLGEHLRRDGQLTTPLLPDLAIELGALFAEN
jgi:Uma2 family endonuclease